MVSLPFTEPSALATVSEPVLKIAAGANTGGGLLNAAANLLGASQGPDPWLRSLVSLSLSQQLLNITDCSTDHVELILVDDEATPPTNLNDQLVISWGNDDSATRFTGAISKIEHTIEGQRRLVLTNAGHTLAHAHTNATFVESATDDILQALADEQGIEGDFGSGATRAHYVVHDGLSLLGHMAELARQEHWLLSVSADNTLRAKPINAGSPVHTFTYGVDLVALAKVVSNPSESSPTVVGTGAATSQGSHAWNWLSKTRAVATSGTAPIITAGSIRDAELATSRLSHHQQRVESAANPVHLRTNAIHPVLPGDSFAISGTAEADGSYIAGRVLLRFDRAQGFITDIQGFSLATSGALLGALGGLF